MRTIYQESQLFSTQPDVNAEYYNLAFKDKAVLRVSSSGISALKNAKPGLSPETITLLETYGFWEMILTSYVEEHEEGFQLTDGLSDTFVVYALGALPVKVSLSGFLFYTKEEDHRIDFIKIYDSLFRGTRAHELGASMSLSVLGTTMDIKVTGSSLTHSAGSDDLVSLSISGIGMKYETTAISVASGGDAKGTSVGQQLADKVTGEMVA